MTGNLCLHFARQDGQDGKNRKENHRTKVTKLPKTKRRKYRMNKAFNINGFHLQYLHLLENVQLNVAQKTIP